MPGVPLGNRMKIHFTSNFPRDIGNSVYCGVYISVSDDKAFVTYKNLLKMADGKIPTLNYYEVSCSVDEDFVLTFSNIEEPLTLGKY